MSPVNIRRALIFDTRPMAALLNAIIARGGTTAITDPVTGDDLGDWMSEPDTCWHVAERAGEVLGFQWIGPHPDVPPQVCDIATFVALGQHGLGTGSALFDATRQAARSRGYRAIQAVIRADNDGGRAYYRSRGFEAVGWLRDQRLSDGTRVDKIVKRYTL